MHMQKSRDVQAALLGRHRGREDSDSRPDRQVGQSFAVQHLISASFYQGSNTRGGVSIE